MSSVKQAWIKKYGKEEGLRKWEKQKKKYGRTKEQYIKEHGDAAWEILREKKRSIGKDRMIKRYGEKEGLKRWNDYLRKWKIGINKKKKEGWKNGQTLCEYQERYGLDDGYKRWKKRYKHHSYMVSEQRYIDEYGKIIGEQICKKIKDNSSLTSFIERYGNKIGKIRYKENCKNCAITIDKMIEKYGKDEGEKRYKEWIFKICESNANNARYSQISQELFWNIYENLNDNYKDKCFFAELNKECLFYINNKDIYPNKIISVDFKLNNKIIEYDCDYWHNKELDEKRDVLLIEKNYSILRINHNDYIINKNKILNQCLEFLLNEKT